MLLQSSSISNEEKRGYEPLMSVNYMSSEHSFYEGAPQKDSMM